jgi:hypothetical protein
MCALFASCRNWLLVGSEAGVMMVIVMVVMMAVNDHYNLRLRRIRHREAEDENQSEQNPFHFPSMVHRKVINRATLTCAIHLASPPTLRA